MVVKDRYMNLECINKARTILLGIATILVTLFHTYSLNFYELINVKLVADLLNFIKSIGNYGVDIFLFLSGIGLYFSYTKNNLKQFYKNRFIRILPEFIIVVVIYNIITKTMTFTEMFEMVFFVAFFIKGNLDVWFLPFIMVLYLIFPLIYKIIKKNDMSGLLLSLLGIVMFNLVYSFLFVESYHRIEIALTRIPVFLFGVFFGKKIYEKKKIPLFMVMISFIIQIVISILLYLNLDITYFSIFARYLYCPLAICSVINISYIFSLLKNMDIFLLKPLKFLGNHSLEIYLIYVKVNYILQENYLFSSYIVMYLVSFCITIVLSYVLKKLVNMMVNKIDYLAKIVYKCYNSKSGSGSR